MGFQFNEIIKKKIDDFLFRMDWFVKEFDKIVWFFSLFNHNHGQECDLEIDRG